MSQSLTQPEFLLPNLNPPGRAREGAVPPGAFLFPKRASALNPGPLPLEKALGRRTKSSTLLSFPITTRPRPKPETVRRSVLALRKYPPLDRGTPFTGINRCAVPWSGVTETRLLPYAADHPFPQHVSLRLFRIPSKHTESLPQLLPKGVFETKSKTPNSLRPLVSDYTRR